MDGITAARIFIKYAGADLAKIATAVPGPGGVRGIAQNVVKGGKWVKDKAKAVYEGAGNVGEEVAKGFSDDAGHHTAGRVIGKGAVVAGGAGLGLRAKRKYDEAEYRRRLASQAGY